MYDSWNDGPDDWGAFRPGAFIVWALLPDDERNREMKTILVCAALLAVATPASAQFNNRYNNLAPPLPQYNYAPPSPQPGDYAGALTRPYQARPGLGEIFGQPHGFGDCVLGRSC
jgi:hypothetical protein